jgi:multidrug efflux pump subunit AcrA (membrane-fusion protein)
VQIKDYAQRLSAAEDRLAAFKKGNVGLMPSDQGGYFAQLQNEVDAAKKAETELSIALSRREELTKQLHSDSAISAAGTIGPLVNGQGVTGGGDTLSRIRETQARLDELLLRFTDKHPCGGAMPARWRRAERATTRSIKAFRSNSIRWVWRSRPYAARPNSIRARLRTCASA